MGSVALEQQIIEQVRNLDAERQRQVLEYVQSLAQTPTQSPDSSWLERADAIYEKVRAELGEQTISVQDLLDEVREERLNDLLGGR